MKPLANLIYNTGSKIFGVDPLNNPFYNSVRESLDEADKGYYESLGMKKALPTPVHAQWAMAHKNKGFKHRNRDNFGIRGKRKRLTEKEFQQLLSDFNFASDAYNDTTIGDAIEALTPKPKPALWKRGVNATLGAIGSTLGSTLSGAQTALGATAKLVGKTRDLLSSSAAVEARKNAALEKEALQGLLTMSGRYDVGAQDEDSILARTLIRMKHGAKPIVDSVSGLMEGYVEFSDGVLHITWKGTLDNANRKKERTAGANDIPTDALAQLYHTNTDEVKTRSGVLLEKLPVVIGFSGGFYRRFQDCYESMRSNIIQILEKQGLNWDSPVLPFPVRITGHSLGGALAEICGVVLKLKHPNWDISVATFAPAKGLTTSEANQFAFGSLEPLVDLENKTIRYTSFGDVVNKVPLHRQHLGEDSWRISDSFNPASHGASRILEAIMDKDPMLGQYQGTVTPGKGGKLIFSQRRRKRKISSSEMKRRMAYVRSFKKK